MDYSAKLKLDLLKLAKEYNACFEKLTNIANKTFFEFCKAEGIHLSREYIDFDYLDLNQEIDRLTKEQLLKYYEFGDFIDRVITIKVGENGDKGYRINQDGTKEETYNGKGEISILGLIANLKGKPDPVISKDHKKKPTDDDVRKHGLDYGELELDYIPKKAIDIYERFTNAKVQLKSLIIDSKYFPIMGLTVEEMDILKGNLVESDLVDSYSGTEAINIYLATKELQNRENIIRRLVLIGPITLNCYLDKPTAHFYKQIRLCFVDGHFEAVCVLSRAIIETMAKKLISTIGYEKHIVGKNIEKKKYSMPNILKKYAKISNEQLKRYRSIVGKADSILHEKYIVDEKSALDVVENLQQFIQKFPRSI